MLLFQFIYTVSRMQTAVCKEKKAECREAESRKQRAVCRMLKAGQSVAL
jgi:hypothetical protein